MNCYFTTSNFYLFILINFAYNHDSCFPCNNLPVLCIQGQLCGCHCCGACVPSIVAALEPAVNSCARATCPSRIAEPFPTAYCATDNFNGFNPFGERTLVVVCDANLGCSVGRCGIGVSANVLYLTFLEQTVLFSYV